ncbi:SET domain-containing protein [Violaceomyces palustris]|uniref:SET domain-containing protein n=1 Tax=Violaceomyces palustris TaxID=1673888 RepID=A0ACD0NV43_9BASI|nr:SET domain-containing protein [Violaceomyces palustris]
MTTTSVQQTTCPVEADFLKWFRRSGGYLDHRAKITPVPNMGRGMIATKDFEKGETLFSIPRHLLLNLSTTQLPSLCSKFDQDQNDGGASQSAISWEKIRDLGWAPLILSMMWERRRSAQMSGSIQLEKGQKENEEEEEADVSMRDAEADASILLDEGNLEDGREWRQQPRAFGQQEWGPYFDIMPTEFSTPMFWPEEDLESLQGTSVSGKVGREEAEQIYNDNLLPFIRSRPSIFFSDPPRGHSGGIEEQIGEWYSMDIYHQMGSRILSRSFHVKSSKKGKGAKSEAAGDETEEEEEEAEGPADENEMDEQHDGEGEDRDGDHSRDLAVGDESKGEDERNKRGEDGEHDDDDDDDEEDDDEEEEEETENVMDISMTPMADLLNAKFESDNARLFYKTNTLEMRTTKAIKAGEQIFNTYADPPNSDLVRRYGHVDEPNGSDVVELPAELIIQATLKVLSPDSTSSSDDKEKELNKRLEWACEKVGLDEVFILNYLFQPSERPPHRPQPERPSPKELKSAAKGGGVPEEMITLTRLLLLSQEDFQEVERKGRLPSPRIEAFHEVQVEDKKKGTKTKLKLAVSQIMIDAIDLRLGQYPNGKGTEEDEKLLYGPGEERTSDASRPLSENRNLRNAVVVRLGEKRVLHDQRRVLEYVLARVKDEIRSSSKMGNGQSSSTASKRKPGNGGKTSTSSSNGSIKRIRK